MAVESVDIARIEHSHSLQVFLHMLRRSIHDIDRFFTVVGKSGLLAAFITKHPNLTEVLVNYLLSVTKATKEQFMNKLEQLSEQDRAVVNKPFISLADRLFMEGEAKGIFKGISQGITQGKLEAQINIAKKLLDKGLSVTEVASISGLDEAAVNKLRQETYI